MSNKIINARIKNKRDTDSNWQSKNPVLLNGEIILVDMNDGELRVKIGNGTSNYNQLSFSDEILRNLIDGTEDKVNTLQDLVGDTSVSDQIELAISGHTHPVDSALSNTSTNPVQNRVVFNAVQALIDGLGDEPVADQINAAVGECITDLSVSGTTITYTKAGGESGTITTQDEDTTYGVVTASSDGLMSSADKKTLDNLSNLVGDTSVSEQINKAMSGTAGSADKLNMDAGSSTNPVYFSGGVPVACTYSLNKTVPSDAKFTDTDTKVTQTSVSSTNTSSAGHYPILLAYSKSPVSGTSSTANYNSQFTANPYTGQIITPMLKSDNITAKRIEMGTDDGSGKLYFRTAEDSKIIGNTPSGVDCEMMRIGGDTTTPLLIIGDGLYTNKIGKTNISAGKAVQIITQNERVILEDIGSSSYSGYFRPNTNGMCALGTTGNRWKQLFAATTSISTSDEREKNNIIAIADYPSMLSEGNVFEILFSRLVPKTFYLNLENDAPELHIGFVAQDIVSVLEELGISENDIAFLHHGYWVDEETGEEKDAYGLRYEEFIPLNTYMIQKLISEKEETNGRLEKIEAMLGIDKEEQI